MERSLKFLIHHVQWGAHVKLANSKKIGILVVGDFEPGDYVELPFIGEVKINSEPPDNPTVFQKNLFRR